MTGISQSIYTLEKCKELAIKNNTKIKNRVLDVEISKQTKKEVFTKLFPNVSAMGIIAKSNEGMIQKQIHMPPILSSFLTPINIELFKEGKTANISAIQPLFVGGQIVNGNKLASIGVEVNKLKVKLTENEVNQLTEKYFWQIVSLKEKTKTIDAIEAQLNEIHKTVKVAVQAGITTNNDLLKVELKQQSVESARLKLENGIKISMILLKQHIGANDSLIDIAFSEFPPIHSPMQFYTSPNSAVLNRTESQLLDMSVEAAKLQRDMAIGENYPMLAVGASYVYHDLIETNTDFGMVFATVSIPISSWWGGAHAIKRENIKKQQAENTSYNAKEMMSIDIQAKWNELEEAYKQVLISEKSIILAKENLRMSKDYYDAGITSLSDLLEAQTSLQNILDQCTDAKTTYQTKLTTYLHSIGK